MFKTRILGLILSGLMFSTVAFGVKKWAKITPADITVEEKETESNVKKDVLQCFQALQAKAEPDDFIHELYASQSEIYVSQSSPQTLEPPVTCGKKYWSASVLSSGTILRNHSMMYNIYPYLFVDALRELYFADEACKRKEEGICALEFDPIVHAQDVPREPWKVVRKHTNNDVSQFDLEGYFDKSDVEPHRVSIFLVKQGGLWKIKDTSSSLSNEPLTAYLERGLKELGYIK